MLGQKSDGLCVGLCHKLSAALGKLCAQFAEILNDPVVDNGNRARLVRMRVVYRWRTMCSPAGMSDA